VVSGQLSVVSRQPSAVSRQLSAVSRQLQLSAFSYQPPEAVNPGNPFYKWIQQNGPVRKWSLKM
jgi:hypothetical protein